MNDCIAAVVFARESAEMIAFVHDAFYGSGRGYESLNLNQAERDSWPRPLQFQVPCAVSELVGFDSGALSHREPEIGDGDFVEAVVLPGPYLST